MVGIELDNFMQVLKNTSRKPIGHATQVHGYGDLEGYKTLTKSNSRYIAIEHNDDSQVSHCYLFRRRGYTVYQLTNCFGVTSIKIPTSVPTKVINQFLKNYPDKDNKHD